MPEPRAPPQPKPGNSVDDSPQHAALLGSSPVGLAWPALEQWIRLDAASVDGRLVARTLTSARADGIAGALAGRPVQSVPRLLPQLFPLCGTAHAVAGVAAIEEALGIVASPAELAFRELILLAEHGAALGWRVLMDWAPLIGQPPEAHACGEIRRTAAAVGATASAGAERGHWARIGGTRRRPDRNGLGRTVSEIARRLVDLFPEAADPVLSLGGLERAMQRGASIPARMISGARAGALAEYGRHDRPLLASRTADWFAARLAAEPGFCRAPTLDGIPAEVGPLAAQRHPMVADAVAQWGPTLATRLLAAALDAPVVAQRLQRTLDRLADADPVEVDLARSGCGTGIVETARGPLAYFIEVEGGRAKMLRSVAPTEWNFHPDGPFMAALAAAPRLPDPVLAARLLAASFDPCVPLRIEMAPDDRPPPNAGSAHHA